MAYQNQCIGTDREQIKKVETGDLPSARVNPKEHFNHDQRAESPTFLYRFYDQDRLLYVGITCSPWLRCQQHSISADWFFLADRVCFQEYPTLYLAEIAEAQAIRDESPEYNRKFPYVRPLSPIRDAWYTSQHGGKLIGTPREWFYLLLDPLTGVTFDPINAL